MFWSFEIILKILGEFQRNFGKNNSEVFGESSIHKECKEKLEKRKLRNL